MSDLTTVDTDLVEGYPSDELLEAIPYWTGTPRELVEHVLTDVFRGYGGVKVTDEIDFADRPVKKLRLVTGGWSGNESMISALKESFFWTAWWESSQRGGAYTFEIPMADYDKAMIDWSQVIDLNRRRRDWRAQARDHVARRLLDTPPSTWADTEVGVTADESRGVKLSVVLLDNDKEMVARATAYYETATDLLAELFNEA